LNAPVCATFFGLPLRLLRLLLLEITLNLKNVPLLLDHGSGVPEAF
jgi:hypothetical protein